MWKVRSVRAVLLDISGVLKNSKGEEYWAIPGSIEAVNRLKESDLCLRFCTNETTVTRNKLVKELQNLGFNIEAKEVFSPAPAVCHILQQRGLRPHLLIHPDLEPDFEHIDRSNPNCVVIGDAQDAFTYENLNKAFKILLSLKEPVLISMGQGKYYKEETDLVLDVGPYKCALEYACDITAEVVGKPSESFFHSVLDDMGVKPEDTVMIGDDIENDVGGAQSCGMQGVLVRTGKFRPSDENHPKVRPDGIAEDLAEAVRLLLQHS